MKKSLLVAILMVSAAVAQTTPNLGLNIPTPGTATNNWGNLLNQNFQIIDQQVYSHTSLPMTVAANCPGNDVFAQANACAIGLPVGGGTVVIPPGTYNSVTTTLNCVSNVEFWAAGVTVNWTGTSGNAISCANVLNAKIRGPLNLLGTKASGTAGIYLGSGAANSGLTQKNLIENVLIGTTPAAGASNGFGVGIRVDGNINAGTYYNVLQDIVTSGNLNQGFLCKPTASFRAGSNLFLSITATGNGGDNFQVDGCNDSLWMKLDSELAGACGFNWAASLQTYADVVEGGDFETNTTADFCFGGANVSSVLMTGMNVNSTTTSTGLSSAGAGIIFLPLSGSSSLNMGSIQYDPGSSLDLDVNQFTASNPGFPGYAFQTRDAESSNAEIFAIHRSAAGVGTIQVGSAGYPATIGGKLNQTVTKTFGGTCAMGGGSSCTFSLTGTYTSPVCIATVQSASVIAGGCTVSGTTVTITAASGNSSTWGAMIFGNPN